MDEVVLTPFAVGWPECDGFGGGEEGGRSE